jgi:hypothetical protein
MRTVDKVRVPAADDKATPASFNPGCYREVILHRAEETAAIVAELAALLERLGYSAWDRLGVRLALEEAINNGLRHSNPERVSSQAVGSRRRARQVVQGPFPEGW